MRNSTQTNNKSVSIMYRNLPLFHLHWKRVCIFYTHQPIVFNTIATTGYVYGGCRLSEMVRL